ncbi:hypothetical protein GU3_12350 [Oceanimonas sp. GK1]|uniref:DUF3833 domain-containing protein n=1 Tax=Oceanimonas sp. (strain GK1 / IBRC-M 10197) TaxID=511062 RepID=UPI000249505C|nr:DUF3833 domain-containing protein [Oceanimonas sp. GK1]AEY02225.1 hypothetical protein GU3_12350 [Oceanimonas sp. GK1]
MKILLVALTLLLTPLLTSCSSQIADYQGTTPALALDEFFTGELVAFGMVQDRSGKVLRRFRVDMVANWEGNQGVLEEDFFYDDGEQQRRVWQLEKHADGRYTGTAADVVTPAEGRTEGYALNWRYTLAVPVDGKVWHIDFNDWMYLLDENRLINRADMTKWGFKVGEVTLWIERKGST